MLSLFAGLPANCWRLWRCWRSDAAFVPAVAGVPAVVGDLAVASVSVDPIAFLFKLVFVRCTYCTDLAECGWDLAECRSEIAVIIFCCRTIGISNIGMANEKLYRTSYQVLNLSDYYFPYFLMLSVVLYICLHWTNTLWNRFANSLARWAGE